MAFTYDFAVKSDVSRIRLALGDTVRDSGVLPDGKNFSDDEIEAILVECNNDVDATTFVFLKSLANTWGTYVDITVGPRKESLSQIAAHYSRRAAELAKQTGLSAKAFTVLLSRVDGYSESASDQ